MMFKYRDGEQGQCMYHTSKRFLVKETVPYVAKEYILRSHTWRKITNVVNDIVKIFMAFSHAHKVHFFFRKYVRISNIQYYIQGPWINRTHEKMKECTFFSSQVCKKHVPELHVKCTICFEQSVHAFRVQVCQKDVLFFPHKKKNMLHFFFQIKILVRVPIHFSSFFLAKFRLG